MKPRTSLVVVALLTFAFMALAWPLDCFAGKEARAIKRIGRCMDRIHAIDHKCQLKRTSEADAAAAMFAEVEGISNAALAISDTAAIKQPLQEFLSKWSSAELIQASIADGRQLFMADVTGFYLRGLVEHCEGSKTWFPIFRP